VQCAVVSSQLAEGLLTCTAVFLLGCKRDSGAAAYAMLSARLAGAEVDVDVLHCVDSARRLSNGRGEGLLDVLVGVGGEERKRG